MSTNIFAKTIFLQRTLEAQIMTKVRALVYHRLYDSAYGFLHTRLSQKNFKSCKQQNLCKFSGQIKAFVP